MPVYVPSEQQSELICEVDLESIFADTRLAFGTDTFKVYNFGGVPYDVNIGNNKYQVFDVANRRCQCCGIIGNRMFLGRYEENGETGYNFRLFAETKDRPDHESHMILMTKDHIIEKKNGGGDEFANLQCLCVLCNNMKAVMGLTVEQIRGCMFNAYRIYRGTLILQKTKRNLEPYYRKAEKAGITAEAIRNGLSKVTDDARRVQMLAKHQDKVEEARNLRERLAAAEERAQSQGVELFAADVFD